MTISATNNVEGATDTSITVEGTHNEGGALLDLKGSDTPAAGKNLGSLNFGNSTDRSLAMIRGISTAADAADMVFYTESSNNAIEESMRIFSTGQVNVGGSSTGVGGVTGNGQLNAYNNTAGDWAIQARSDSVNANGLFVRAGSADTDTTALFTGYDEANVAMKINGEGNVTKPTQCAFHVTKGTNQSPIGATINVEYQVSFTSEEYDIGSNFSGSQFTAPVAGKYVFQAQCMLTGTETGGNYYWMRINTSNGNIGEIQSIKYASNPTYLSLGSHCIVDLAAGDTAWVGVRYGSVVGSNPDIVVDDSWTWFMGYLLG